MSQNGEDLLWYRVLIDERFTHARYRRLFPSHWQGFQVLQSNGEIQDCLERFWSRE